MPEKAIQEKKSVIRAFYQGGTKLQADTTHTPSELKGIMDNARSKMVDAEVNTVSEDETVATEKLYISRNGLLFYSILERASKKSDLIIAPAGAIPGTGV